MEYKAKCAHADQYAYVATGQTITADKLAALHKMIRKNLKENEELKGWNTKKDGSGDMVTAETVVIRRNDRLSGDRRKSRRDSLSLQK